MNKQQIESIKEILRRIMGFEYEQRARDVHGENYLDFQLEQGFSVREILNLLRRALDQLKAELDSSQAIALPYAAAIPDTQHPSGSNWTLHQALSGLAEVANDVNSFNSIAIYTQWLVSYEVFCGFWDRSEKKVHSVDEMALKEQQLDISRLIKRLNESLKKTEELTVQQTEAIRKIEELHQLKTDELATISNLVGKASNEAAEITQLWQQASSQKGEFDNLINQATESIKNVNAQIERQKGEFAELKNSFSSTGSELNDIIKISKESQKEILTSKEEIQLRMKQAAELLGLSADVALGSKFSLREVDVRKSLFWWRIAVVSSVVVAIIWAVVVFLQLATKTELPYLDILVNLVKTSPGFILMAYIMAQYNKERAIEEEYAFKSAIAMTINAYANLLKENDTGQNTSRQTMLLDAIRQVYAKPEMHKENVKAKTYKETAEELIDILKNIKS